MYFIPKIIAHKETKVSPQGNKRTVEIAHKTET